jgi:hypothetical protein
LVMVCVAVGVNVNVDVSVGVSVGVGRCDHPYPAPKPRPKSAKPSGMSRSNRRFIGFILGANRISRKRTMVRYFMLDSRKEIE